MISEVQQMIIAHMNGEGFMLDKVRNGIVCNYILEMQEQNTELIKQIAELKKALEAMSETD